MDAFQKKNGSWLKKINKLSVIYEKEGCQLVSGNRCSAALTTTRTVYCLLLTKERRSQTWQYVNNRSFSKNVEDGS